jgi:hypothetical protein
MLLLTDRQKPSKSLNTKRSVQREHGRLVFGVMRFDPSQGLQLSSLKAVDSVVFL